MIFKLVLATRNKHKITEIRHLLQDLSFQIFCLDDFPEIPEIVEDGNSFEANAIKKAETVFSTTGLPALADDSGLEVDFLNGQPGIFSSRFSGPGATASKNNLKLLNLLKNVPDDQRTARFRCVLALKTAGQLQIVEGACEGVIQRELQGTQGFGYDPLFYIPRLGKTFAELNLDEKNRLSHRGVALSRLTGILKKW